MNLTLSELVLQSDSLGKSLAKDLLTSAAYAALQSPVNGAAQIIDKTVGTDILPSVQVITPVAKAEFGSLKWHAQEVGNAVGMTVPFALLHGGVRSLGKLGGMELQKAGMLTAQSYKNEVLLAGISGIAYGALLTPSHPDEGLLFGRVKNATEQGVTFATLAAAAGGIKLWAQTTEHKLAGRLFKNDVVAAALAGVPAGSVHADAHSLLAGKGLADWKERGHSMYSFMIVGGTLGTAHIAAERMLQSSHTNRAQVEQTALRRNEGTAPAFSLGERGRLGATERSRSVEPPEATEAVPKEGTPKEVTRDEVTPDETSSTTRTANETAPKDTTTTDTRTQETKQTDSAANIEPVPETWEMRQAREKAEGIARIAEFLNRPNPTSLAESCLKLEAEFRRRLQEAEQRAKEQEAFTQQRIAEYNDAAAKLEQFAANCGPKTTFAELSTLVNGLMESGNIRRELREIIEAHKPAQTILTDWSGQQYRVFEDGSCQKTRDGKPTHDGHSSQVVFVDSDTARTIRDLYEDGELAGKTFPASKEFKPDSTAVQIGDATFDDSPLATIGDGTVTFPNRDGFSGVVRIGGEIRAAESYEANTAQTALTMADTLKKEGVQSAKYGKTNAEFQAKDIQTYNEVLAVIQQFPKRFQNDNPNHMTELPQLLRERLPQLEDYKIQPLIEAVYDHVPARLVFETEKGSAYRFYVDGSLGRLKSNGVTKDRCENQYFVEAPDGQRLLDAANDKGLQNFSLSATLEPAVGLSPLSLHEAGRPASVMPTFSNGRLTWPEGYRVSWEGHLGHQITKLRHLIAPPPEVIAARAAGR